MTQIINSAQVGVYEGCGVVYDLRSSAIDHDITDYSLYLIRKKNRSPLTVGQIVGHLVVFRRFLLRQPNSGLAYVHEETMLAFQREQLDSVKESRSYRGDERLAKNTVNQKLSAVYCWMVWLRDEGRLDDSVIGERGCQVRTREKAIERFDGKRKRVTYVIEVPIAYRGIGRGSKHSTAYAATKNDIDAVTERIAETATSEYLLQRNGLLAVIPQLTGLRRGSMNSLLVSQFDRGELHAETEPTVLVTPKDQKFGYSSSFDFPTLLALRILDFIDGPRTELLDALGIDESIAKGRVFLSETTGKPLTSRAITKVMSREMRAIGAPKGAAVHAGRHLFANDMINQEIEDRTKEGQDTSTASICCAVALKMGQRNPDSLFAYVSAQQSRYAKSQLEKSRQRSAAARVNVEIEEHSSIKTGTDAAAGVSDRPEHPVKLLVVDINALGFAALRDPKYRDSRHFGRRTGAVIGALEYLTSRCSVDRGRTPVVVWDDRCTWRKALYAGYKAERWTSSDQQALLADYLWQCELLRGLLAHLGVLQVSAAGFEADDVAGYMCRNASANWSIRLVTNDSDWLQALRPGVDLVSLPLNSVITEDDLRNVELVRGGPFYSVEHYIAAKSLAGDASDEIPGVPGVGIKSAARIISEFDSVESLWARFDEGSLPERKILRRVAGPEYRDQYRRNRCLIDWALAPSLRGQCRIDPGEVSIDNFRSLAFKNGLALRIPSNFVMWSKCDPYVVKAIRRMTM